MCWYLAGGIGAGALELRADGTFHEVTIMNASPAGAAKFGVLADMVLAVRVATASGTVTKLVRTSAPSFAADAGLQGVDSITYSGSYPVSRLMLQVSASSLTRLLLCMPGFCSDWPADSSRHELDS